MSAPETASPPRRYVRLPDEGPLARWSGWMWARAVLVLTAMLHTLAFPPFHVPEAAWVFATPALLWFHRRPRRNEFLLIIGGATFVSWAILLEWLRHVTVGGMLALAAIMAAFHLAWFAAARWALPRAAERDVGTRVAVVLGLAGLWVLIEWVRSWILTGFPWLPLAASQWQRPAMLQAAAIGGSWTISFALVLFNLGLTAYLRRLQLWVRERKGRFCPEFYLAMFVLFLVSFGAYGDAAKQDREPLLKAGFVQPDIRQDQKWDPAAATEILDILNTQTRLVVRQKPDVIFWPEAVMPAPIVGDPDTQRWIENLTDDVNTSIVFGAVAYEERSDDAGELREVWRNGVFTTMPGAGLQEEQYSKRHLVPFGEYVPLRRFFPNIAKFVPIGGDFEPGAEPVTLLLPVDGRIVTVAPLVCYEDVFARLARRSVRRGADVLFVATNDAWYGEKGAAYQHAAHSVLRAVETRRPVIRVGNAGWSGWIDEYGRTRAVMLNENRTIYYRGSAVFAVDHDTRWVDQLSPYVRYGDWFVALSAAMSAIAVVLLRRPANGLKFQPLDEPASVQDRP